VQKLGDFFMVKDHSQAKRQRRYKRKARYDHPEPGPILFLTRKLANRNRFKEIRAKQRKEFTDGIIRTGTPDVRGIFIIYMKHIMTTQRDEAQLALENLVQHDEQH
jgi:hypothetical protein